MVNKVSHTLLVVLQMADKYTTLRDFNAFETATRCIQKVMAIEI